MPGMISEANQVALQAAGLSFILGTGSRICPTWCANGETSTQVKQIPDGLVLTQPWPATSAEKARGIPDRVTYYQYPARPGPPHAARYRRAGRQSRARR